jgi:hypothetical protein
MITLDFLFTAEVIFCMEQAGALTCGLLPVIHKEVESRKIDDLRWQTASDGYLFSLTHKAVRLMLPPAESILLSK